MGPERYVRLFEELGRELQCVVRRDGVIVWCDDHARAAGLSAEGSLERAVVPGTEPKLHELLRRAIEQRVTGWELSLVIGDRPATLLLSAAPAHGHIALVGSFIPQDVAEAVEQGRSAYDEIVGLNRELVRQRKKLEESNLAIKTLHAELEQQADRLRTSAEVKARLVATVSHEFRTPLHSILGLSRLLVEGTDGPLSSEQMTQLQFIRSSAEELSTMVNDVLDLAKLDSGMSPIRIERFNLADFLSAMRGTMAPLLPAGHQLALVFDAPPDVALETDLGKLNQIVRNLIANAIKYSERGTIRITTEVRDDELILAVADSGPGIALEDHERVFEEFVQLESGARRARGTGLGLPVARKLAELLGGRIALASELGQGATFTVSIPMEHAEVESYKKLEAAARAPDPDKAPVLVVEDDRDSVFVYERYMAMAGFQVMPARSTSEARAALKRVRPSAILLDVMLEGEDTWAFLEELKGDPHTRDIPVLVCTIMDRESRARALGADEFWLKPVDEDKLIRKLQTISSGLGATVLAIDDDPKARYLIAKCLQNTPYQLLEAEHGHTGIELAKQRLPDVILLDFLLDDVTAFDVIDALKADPRTRGIPIIVVTSQQLGADERRRLSAHTAAVLSKEHLSRELAIQRIRDALRSVARTRKVRPS